MRHRPERAATVRHGAAMAEHGVAMAPVGAKAVGAGDRGAELERAGKLGADEPNLAAAGDAEDVVCRVVIDLNPDQRRLMAGVADDGPENEPIGGGHGSAAIVELGEQAVADLGDDRLRIAAADRKGDRLAYAWRD